MRPVIRPYPEYRNSGVHWVPRIPHHWELRRNGRLFAHKVTTGFPDLPVLEVSLKTGVRVRDFESGARKQVMSDREKYKRADAGDIAYNMMRMWQGAVGVAPVAGLVSPAYVVAHPYPEADSRYYAYLFRTDAYKNEVNKYSHGIVADRNRLYWDEFKQMPSLFPPPEEQRAIVAFLDDHGRHVNQLIRAKRRLIDLLNEQKQAIIHRAVTRGLDPNVKLKPSGVEWLEDVPEHWRPCPIRRLAMPVKSAIVNGPFGSDLLVSELGPTGVPVVYIRDISSGRYARVSTACVTPEKAGALAFCSVEAGDVLVAKVGDPPGTAAVYPDDSPPGIVTQDVVRIKADGRIVDPQYLALLLNSPVGRQVIGRITVESTRGRFGLSDFRGAVFCLPPVREQERILDGLEARLADISGVTESLSAIIRLLQQYRLRMISDIVTGQLDVREAVSTIPDGADQSNVSDEAFNAADDTGDDDNLEPASEESVE